MSSWQDLLDLSDRFEGRAARAYLEAVHRIRTELSRRALQRLIAAQDLADLGRQFNGVVDVVVQSYQAQGRATAADLVERMELAGAAHFDITNPTATRIAREQSSRLIVQITESIRDSVRTIIATANEVGIPVRDTATLVETFIGLDPRRAAAAIRYRASLRDLGLNAATIEARSARYVRKLLRDRALTIARTEVMFATNAGQRESWRQAQADGLLRAGQLRRWIITPDDRLCPICRRMDGATTTLDRPFSRAGRVVMSAPLHPRCRCTEVLVRPARR